MGERLRSFWVATMAVAMLGGCSAPQIYPTVKERNISLQPGDLEAHGIAFITPSAATGQEEERQAIALVFAETLREKRPNVRVVALAQTLGAVNQAGLADAYRRMYAYHRETGLFKADILAQIGKATQTRYLAQIQVQGFNQDTKDRFGAFGLRLVETKRAAVRLFFQVWDSQTGTVAWEATDEVHYAYDTVTEEQLTLTQVVGQAAEDLVAKLP